jgi:hypothetical protein
MLRMALPLTEPRKPLTELLRLAMRAETPWTHRLRRATLTLRQKKLPERFQFTNHWLDAGRLDRLR